MNAKNYRQISAAEILEWRRTDSPLIRVRTDTDAVPGGLSMAMAPMFVKWDASSAGFGPDDYYIVQNVNIINNPVGAITVLGTLKVWADSIDHTELVMVISKVKGVETPGGHAMLRFVFREDRRPAILDRGGNPLSNNATATDFVISWEAWRPPTAGFDPVAGLDPDTYALTPRCSIGAVRCLADSMLDRPWHCYPLRLPDVEHAHNELFYVSLAMADAVARQTVLNLLDRRIEEGRSLPEDYPEAELDDWETLADVYRNSEVPEDPIRDILEGRVRYHLLERSCITMALSSVDWANHRIHERAGLGEPKSVRVAPETMPPALQKLAAGKRTAFLLRAPAALHWLMTHQTVIPSKAHELLDEVGLLYNDGGHIHKTHYDNRKHTPYGELGENIIY